VPQAADEYDNYVPRVRSALQSSGAEVAIAEVLLEIERLQMGLPGDPERANKVSRQLLALTRVHGGKPIQKK
jgi:hypothetical protein